jgi:hypothetical protein
VDDLEGVLPRELGPTLERGRARARGPGRPVDAHGVPEKISPRRGRIATGRRRPPALCSAPCASRSLRRSSIDTAARLPTAYRPLLRAERGPRAACRLAAHVARQTVPADGAGPLGDGVVLGIAFAPDRLGARALRRPPARPRPAHAPAGAARARPLRCDQRRAGRARGRRLRARRAPRSSRGRCGSTPTSTSCARSAGSATSARAPSWTGCWTVAPSRSSTTLLPRLRQAVGRPGAARGEMVDTVRLLRSSRLAACAGARSLAAPGATAPPADSGDSLSA